MNNREHRVAFCRTHAEACQRWQGWCRERPDHDLTIFIVNFVGESNYLYACTTYVRDYRQ
ncbi:MAG: hypothetical protein AAF773_00065 [Cyanobacteria bacterium P01_D01_bin.115]